VGVVVGTEIAALPESVRRRLADGSGCSSPALFGLIVGILSWIDKTAPVEPMLANCFYPWADK
jgi:hypothetical protein